MLEATVTSRCLYTTFVWRSPYGSSEKFCWWVICCVCSWLCKL